MQSAIHIGFRLLELNVPSFDTKLANNTLKFTIQYKICIGKIAQYLIALHR